MLRTKVPACPVVHRFRTTPKRETEILVARKMETVMRVVQTVTGYGIARIKIDHALEVAQIPDREDPVETDHETTKG
jgi:hypothetical protein